MANYAITPTRNAVGCEVFTLHIFPIALNTLLIFALSFAWERHGQPYTSSNQHKQVWINLKFMLVYAGLFSRVLNWLAKLCIIWPAHTTSKYLLIISLDWQKSEYFLYKVILNIAK